MSSASFSARSRVVSIIMSPPRLPTTSTIRHCPAPRYWNRAVTCSFLLVHLTHTGVLLLPLLPSAARYRRLSVPALQRGHLAGKPGYRRLRLLAVAVPVPHWSSSSSSLAGLQVPRITELANAA